MATFFSGILRSTDGGRTWSPSGLEGLTIADLATDPRDSQVLYAIATARIKYFRPSSGNSGIFESTDGGRSWERIGHAITNPYLTSITLDPSNPDTVYVTIYGDGVYRSRDGGRTWEPLNRGLTNKDLQALVIDPRRPNVLYVGANDTWRSAYTDWQIPEGPGAVFKSEDSGRSWRKLNSFPRYPLLPEATVNVEAMVLDPTDPETIYVAAHSPGVYRTRDGGRTWELVNEGLLVVEETRIGHAYVWALAISRDGSVIYASACNRGVLRARP